jgi:hypothetical protein
MRCKHAHLLALLQLIELRLRLGRSNTSVHLRADEYRINQASFSLLSLDWRRFRASRAPFLTHCTINTNVSNVAVWLLKQRTYNRRVIRVCFSRCPS